MWRSSESLKMPCLKTSFESLAPIDAKRGETPTRVCCYRRACSPICEAEGALRAAFEASGRVREPEVLQATIC